MASDLNKHKAEILKIAGLSCISPLGRIIIQPTVVFNEFDLFGFCLYSFAAFCFFSIGFLFIVRSYDMLKETRN